jgi:hypothetical protein
MTKKNTEILSEQHVNEVDDSYRQAMIHGWKHRDELQERAN